MLPVQPAQADDDYLKMLESEASDLKLDQSGQIDEKASEHEEDDKDGFAKANWKWDGELDGDTLPKGLAEDEFAALIKQHFYGTYVFFRKLNANDRRTVYYHYKKSPKPDLNDVRKDILSLLKQQ